MTCACIHRGNSVILVLATSATQICVCVLFPLNLKKKHKRINYLQKQSTQLALGAKAEASECRSREAFCVTLVPRCCCCGRKHVCRDILKAAWRLLM